MTRLRGNTFLLLLLRAGNASLSAPVEYGKNKDGITRPNMLADLLRMSNPAYACRKDATLASYFSKYLSGVKPFSKTYYDFQNPVISHGLDQRLRSDYLKVIREMQDFCDLYLCNDAGTLQYLVAGLIDAILSDDTFYGSFNIGSRTVSKEELNDLTQVSLLPFLLSIWNHILMDHQDASEGKETYEEWTCPDGYNTPRRISTKIGQERAQRIIVTVDLPDSIQSGSHEEFTPEYCNAQDVDYMETAPSDDLDDTAAMDAVPVSQLPERLMIKDGRIYYQQANTIYNIEHIDTFKA